MKIKVESFDKIAYIICYKKESLFACWYVLTHVDASPPDNYIRKFAPCLFFNINKACEYAKKLKNDPSLIDKHNKEQKNKYLALKTEFKNKRQSKNKTKKRKTYYF
jgi:hypothetical protein